MIYYECFYLQKIVTGQECKKHYEKNMQELFPCLIDITEENIFSIEYFGRVRCQRENAERVSHQKEQELRHEQGDTF